MPDPVHESVPQRDIAKTKCFHADDGYVKLRYHPTDQNVRKEETRNGDEKVREKSGGPIIEPPSHDGCSNSNGKGKSPRDNGAYYEKGQAVQEPLPDL
jgi:hypothetical protein